MTCEEDIKAVNKYLPDYIGFVLFFPKSKRNISIKQAKDLLAKVDKQIKNSSSCCLTDNRTTTAD